MKQQVILKIDTLENVIKQFKLELMRTQGQNAKPEKALYMFANKPGTSFENDAYEDYSKFNSLKEAAEYYKAFAQTKFVVEYECVDKTKWIHNKDQEAEYVEIIRTYSVTVTPTVNSKDDAFVAFTHHLYSDN